MRFSHLIRSAFAIPMLTLAACGGATGGLLEPPPSSTAMLELASDPARDGFVYSADGGFTGGASTGLDIRVGDDSADRTRRGFLSFELNGVPPGATIVSATLEVSQEMTQGAPYFLGPDLLVDHVELGGALGLSDFASPPLHPAFGVLSSLNTDEVKSMDVTAMVQDDIDNGRTYSEYRLWFPSATNNDGAFDAAYFNAAEDSHGSGLVPVLIVEWQE